MSRLVCSLLFSLYFFLCFPIFLFGATRSVGAWSLQVPAAPSQGTGGRGLVGRLEGGGGCQEEEENQGGSTKQEKEQEIARRVKAGERRSDVKSELTLEDPTNVDDMVFSEEEESWEVKGPCLVLVIE